MLSHSGVYDREKALEIVDQLTFSDLFTIKIIGESVPGTQFTDFLNFFHEAMNEEKPSQKSPQETKTSEGAKPWIRRWLWFHRNKQSRLPPSLSKTTGLGGKIGHQDQNLNAQSIDSQPSDLEMNQIEVDD